MAGTGHRYARWRTRRSAIGYPAVRCDGVRTGLSDRVRRISTRSPPRVGQALMASPTDHDADGSPVGSATDTAAAAAHEVSVPDTAAPGAPSPDDIAPTYDFWPAERQAAAAKAGLRLTVQDDVATVVLHRPRKR